MFLNPGTGGDSGLNPDQRLANMTPEIKRRQTEQLTDLPDYPEWLRRLFSVRGVTSEQHLNYSLSNLPSPTLMLGAVSAAEKLADAISADERLLIVADYDVDGATSCTLMLKVLRAMGAKHVDYLVPDRFKLGYGLSPAVVELAKPKQPDWLITVDNGIASIDGVAAAKAAGMHVLITDHHLPGEQLPDADVIVNPNQPSCEFPTKALAGVGVAFYVLLALRQELRQRNWFTENNITEPNLAHYLDLVALGTVADLVPLDHLNRCLVSQGLQRINQGLCQPGISTLLDLARGQQELYQAQDLGFSVAPRLNAAGRLDDMTLGIECLLSESRVGALPLAEELNNWNIERRAIQDDMQRQANTIVSSYKAEDLAEQAGLCLYSADWHEGVVGLVASRIKDQVYRPTIVFAPSDDPQHLKGSARSIKGIHIRDVLDQIASQKPNVLQKFGGHAMAAGLTLDKDHLQEFSDCFNEVVLQWADPSVFENVLWSDGELQHQDMTLDNATLLEESGPWGQQFSEPTFDGEFEVYDWQILKDKHIKFQLASDTGGIIEAIAFNVDEDLLETAYMRIKILYRMNVNRFRGSRRVQLLIDYLKPL